MPGVVRGLAVVDGLRAVAEGALSIVDTRSGSFDAEVFRDGDTSVEASRIGCG
ncbi:hypothetical protein EV193_102672 [Herbihabitans rhizosphaerae]|uniref:Uncharacterized protein n=1 Tax=Herbihabitans rhizosphaerae TaxID=1872711 RepID=A0A4Q7L588_9PSEU|nr:hypothetical protein [Herbihabitans rhizosphaerae]RZS43691.1 hypothetical protein EV193_102672 [Herbihabitans rhizosphaerae]